MKFTYRVVVDTNKRQIRLYRAFGLLLVETVYYSCSPIQNAILQIARLIGNDVVRRLLPGADKLIDYLAGLDRKEEEHED